MHSDHLFANYEGKVTGSQILERLKELPISCLTSDETVNSSAYTVSFEMLYLSYCSCWCVLRYKCQRMLPNPMPDSCSN
jgi:hypothetical protein